MISNNDVKKNLEIDEDFKINLNVKWNPKDSKCFSNPFIAFGLSWFIM
jgi:hypothetical protein